MRSKEQIFEDVRKSAFETRRKDALLEVLIDIRDALQKPEISRERLNEMFPGIFPEK